MQKLLTYTDYYVIVCIKSEFISIEIQLITLDSLKLKRIQPQTIKYGILGKVCRVLRMPSLLGGTRSLRRP